MAAAGTRDPAGVAMARQMADMLGERLGREVTACFVAASRPVVAEAVEQVRHRAGPNARVAVASYLLAPGHFQGLVEAAGRSEEHTSELQSRGHLVCRLLLEKKNKPRGRTDPSTT